MRFEPQEDAEAVFEFKDEIKGGAVPKEYIPAVQKGIESVLSAGPIAGFPVLGMKATLVDGGYHDVDSSTVRPHTYHTYTIPILYLYTHTHSPIPYLYHTYTPTLTATFFSSFYPFWSYFFPSEC